MTFDSLFHRNSFVPRLTPILCLLCFASFLGLNIGGENMTWAQSKIYGYLPTISVWQGEPWSLITSTFVHFQIMHILFNVMWLWSMGNIFEDEFGTLKWAIFFVAAAWVSSALQLLSSGDIGIGMSGVVYALIGFGWVARRKHPAFLAIMTQQNIIISVIWLVGCIVATQLHLLNIGNGAHVAGLAFGAAVAGLLVAKWKPLLSGAGLVALVIAAVVPLFWCPLSSDWTGIQALNADKRHDYTTALYWYNRTVALDPTPTSSWALHNMLIIYGEQKDTANYAKALSQLRAKDAKDAKQFEE